MASDDVKPEFQDASDGSDITVAPWIWATELRGLSGVRDEFRLAMLAPHLRSERASRGQSVIALGAVGIRNEVPSQRAASGVGS